MPAPRIRPSRNVPRALACVLSVAALVLAPLVLGAGPARAAAGDVIEAFDVVIDVRADGTLAVRETIRYRFADRDRRGIFRTVPVRYPQPGDPDLERVVEIDDLRVDSPSGAPDQVKSGVEDGQLVIRVGDPDRTVSGTQTYVLQYVVSGAMNAFDETAELSWNVTGNDWDAVIAGATAVVRGPVAPVGTVCFEGPVGATSRCAQRSVEESAASFASGRLDRGEGLTVATAYPVGAVAVPAPVLEERWTIERAFSVEPLPAAAALLALLGGVAAVGYVAWSRGRDRRYVGQVPGLGPATGDPGVEEPAPLVGGPPVVVEFAPPPGMRPGEAGTLVDERADVLDVTATIVDLAVRRYLRIEETGEKKLFFTKRDWTLTKLREADDELKRYERTLLDALFAGRESVTLSALKQTFADDLELVQKQLYLQVVEDGWFRRRPDSTRASYGFLGLVLAGAGAGLTYVLARWTEFGLVGIAAVLSGLAMLWAGRYMPARTGRGSAANQRVLGFREYIRTAEAEQIRFEEREDVFSRYLPFAIVFGETERWARAFASLAAAGGAAGAAGAAGSQVGLTHLYWYSTLGSGFEDFGDSLADFTTTTAGAVAAAAPSGGSSFGGGGGFSGGGFGGGGGGSW